MINKTTWQKNLRLMTCFVLFLVSVSSHAESPAINITSQLQGEWISPKWNYGFRIDGLSGYATRWENKYNANDKTKTGDIILNIEKYTPSGFVGKQLFFSGKLVPVVVNIVDVKTIKLEAGPEVWEMVRPE